jgi:hypothetical protein
VSGSWREPAAKCDQPFPTYSAFWVGLGGFKDGSHALEQIGTEADCTSAGRTNNYAWYELVPAPPIKLKLKIQPGDLISARVTLRNRYLVLRIHNLLHQPRPVPDTAAGGLRRDPFL